jgi:hypothetical protein
MSRPGEFLRFLLVEEEMLVDSAAERTSLTPQQIAGVIAGTLPVDQPGILYQPDRECKAGRGSGARAGG